jgi:hypothetical protein
MEKHGDIEGSKPKEPIVRNRGPEGLNLKVDDIDGTKVGTKEVRAFNYHTRREYRDTNKIEDIPGTKTGSLRKAPVTNRNTNPLNPTYPLLGAKELGEGVDMYGEKPPMPVKPVTAPVKTRQEMLK